MTPFKKKSMRRQTKSVLRTLAKSVRPIPSEVHTLKSHLAARPHSKSAPAATVALALAAAFMTVYQDVMSTKWVKTGTTAHGSSMSHLSHHSGLGFLAGGTYPRWKLTYKGHSAKWRNGPNNYTHGSYTYAGAVQKKRQNWSRLAIKKTLAGGIAKRVYATEINDALALVATP